MTSNDDDPRILRHKGPPKEGDLVAGEAEHIELISEHIERHVGPVAMVFHEIVSPGIHVDIHHVAAAADRPFHLLVTSGMSDLPMTVPEGAEELRSGRSRGSRGCRTSTRPGSESGKVHFLQVMPLYAEEMQLKVERGTDALLPSSIGTGSLTCSPLDTPKASGGVISFLGRRVAGETQVKDRKSASGQGRRS